MMSDQRQDGSRKFFVKQTILLLITVVLAILFTIPLLKAIKSAVNPGELVSEVRQAELEQTGMQNAVDVARSKMLMGAGDEEAQEKLKKQVEELQRQLELKELENKGLQEQKALVQTMLQLVNAKSAPPVPTWVDFWQKLADLAIKVFGSLGSLFSGGIFVLSWWRTKRKPPAVVAS